MIRSTALLLAGLGCAGLAAIGWQSGTGATTVNPATTAISGPNLFLAKGCARCHVGPGNIGDGFEGPSLIDAATWAGSQVAGMSAEAYLDESIQNPTAFRSPRSTSEGAMPGLLVSDAEIDALIDYLLQG